VAGPDPRSPGRRGAFASRLLLARRSLARRRSGAPRTRGGRQVLTGSGVAALLLVGGAGYTVQPGDTLSHIALRVGSTVQRLVDANGLSDPDRIYVGQSLTVPGGPAASPTPAAPPAPATGGDGTYVVRRGDALSLIARRHGVTLRALADANGITDPHRIYAGQRLTIPGSATPSPSPAPSAPPSPAPSPAARPSPSATPAPGRPSGESLRYTVARGDTLSRIATRHGVPLQVVVDANGITDPNRILVGQVLLIPLDGATATPAPAPAPSAPSGPLTREEVGDLIVEVATDYGWNPAWVKALAWQESGWQQSVVSHVGAKGIMQVMPGTGDFVSRRLVGRTLDLDSPRDNVTAGVAFLDYLHDLTGGDIEQTLAGYYQGLASVRRNGMYADTERYIANVIALKARFE
jgi:LysM repeat protein